MKKVDAENKLLEHIKEIGLENYSRMNGEGRTYNNLYYCFNLKNGEQRFWTNPSEEFKTALGIE
jgi:hypothetical protein